MRGGAPATPCRAGCGVDERGDAPSGAGDGQATFTGDHQIKGKSEPQKVYRPDAVRQAATRFEAAVTRGFSTFVDREREFDVLESGLDKSSFRTLRRRSGCRPRHWQVAAAA